ncbi:methyltransferase family protein [Mariniflexile fucanivorans]|uniref:Methyltransferase family protein n=1 Tax=Mariniflexile fucanivorans TaxID=264023 RepID=A0A4R1RH97_9FLAO|nr:class I SAM-dependent methyltransferase [Mariniflexile fucanivorans]TCL65090.1 methyltransferase family protein [Mariniflexile fucanivorans]
MKEMWDKRYSADEYAYGIAPNVFFKDAIKKYNLKGKMLLPAEGEGRNAVYAAKNGLDVTAFDISLEGKKKALKLCEKENVKIKYEVGDFFELDIINDNYDNAALIFAHFPPEILSKYHKKISELILPNGIILLEGFSKDHLKLSAENPNLGGPKNSDLLFSKESIQKDFPDFEIILLEEIHVELNEGDFHNGTGKVIRFIGRKK